MGPLWAWGILWLLSIYGLVYLLRIAMARAVAEPVAVLVANAKPTEPPPPAAADPTLAFAPAADLRAEGAAPEGPERAEQEASEPEIPPPAGPWAEEPAAVTPESFPSPPAEAPDPASPASLEAAEASAAWGGAPVEEIEPVEYRSIDLESLTLGLEATEIQDLYGPPGHLSKIGEDGEQWRYPLNATDERGAGVEGVLVLEFQRGRLVRKALEENEVERRKA